MRIRLCVLIAALAHAEPAVAGDVPPGDRQLRDVINAEIEHGFATRKVTPADACSDAAFIRRVHLDLAGVIPSARTARDFISSEQPDKRTKVIDDLLNSSAHARHMATVFDVMLMERRPDKYVTTPEWREYLAQSFAENKPLNVLVAEIRADGVDEQLRPAAKFYLDRAVEKDTLVRDIGRLFLGVNLQCAQCHDHPDIDDYLHQHYHGLSVFVAGSKTFKQPDGKFVLQEVVMREVEFASVFDPDTTNKTGPRLIDALMQVPDIVEGEEYVEKPSRTVRSVPKFSLRELLAKCLPSDKTPEFARNMANRLWAKMMGRGIVHPLDMHHSDNPPSHPDLLDALARELTATNYDMSGFLRAVALSDAYQRSSLVPIGVEPDSVPVDSFAVANLKGLSPEQLFESLLVATQSSAVLEEQIDRSLAEEAVDDTTDGKIEEDSESKHVAARRAKRNELVSGFVAVFGSVAGTPAGDFTASLPQALFLANSETVAEWVPPRLGNLAERLVISGDPKQIADELFLGVLSRMPTEEEIQLVQEHLDKAGSNRRQAVSQLAWSLLASAEFRLNH